MTSKIPELVIPILQKVQNSKLLPKDLPLEVWKYENYHEWVNIFMELGIELFNSDIDAEMLPLGYSMVGYIFDWEAQLSFDAWAALDNRKLFLESICAAYQAVGLGNESKAIRAAQNVWCQEDCNGAETEAAYWGQQPEFTNEIDRLEYLVCYFIDHANELFYERP